MENNAKNERLMCIQVKLQQTKNYYYPMLNMRDAHNAVILFNQILVIQKNVQESNLI